MAFASPLLAGVSFAANGGVPPWEPDANAGSPYGNVQLFNANGVVITSGSVSSQAFAYAAATTAPDSGSTKATVYWRDPQSGASNPPATWSGPQESFTTPFTPPPGGTPATLVADAASEPVALMYSTATVSSWLTSTTPSLTAGFANTIQVILQDTAINGDPNLYWSTDIAYNTGASAISVDGINVPADSWVQLFPLQSTPATPTLTLSQTGTVNTGTPEQLTASGLPTTPAGDVVFEDNGTVVATVAASAGSATYTVTSPTVGSHSYTASFVPVPGSETGAYSGSATVVTSSTSTAHTVTYQAASISTSTTLTDSAPSINVGGSETLTASVTESDAPVTAGLAGSVQFYDGTNPLGSPVTTTVSGSTGTATLTTTSLPAGTDSITAKFTPTDTDYASSTSSAKTVTVTAIATTTALTDSASSITYGQSETFTASVTESDAPVTTGLAGSVQFYDGTSPLGSPVTTTVSGHTGTAALTTTTLPAGTDSITAKFTPTDTDYASSTSTAKTVTVTAIGTTTALTDSASSTDYGASETFTASVTESDGPITAGLAGSVQFYDGTSPLGSPVTTTVSGHTGTAALTTRALPLGTDSITAKFTPTDPNYASSTSSSTTVTVGPDGTTTTVTSSSPTVQIGHPVTYTATVAANSPGSGTPTSGTVAFFADTSPVATCPAQPVSAGQATCQQTYSTGGIQSITAEYSGNSDYSGSTSMAFTETVITAAPPSAPTALAATTTGAGDGRVDLTWDVPSSSGTSPITGYDVFVSTTSGSWSSIPANSSLITGTSWPVNGLTDGTTYYFVVEAVNVVGSSAASNEVSAIPRAGLLLAGNNGGVYAFGSAGFYGSLGNIHLAAPIVGYAQTPNGMGYWLVGSDGGVFTFGDAGFYGSLGAIKLNQPIVGVAATPDGKGYWLVGRDGGVFTFGDAGFYGSLGGIKLNQPFVGVAATPDGKGYWLAASDGGVFTFGDAGFYGSLGGIKLNQPIVGMAATPNGKGYWLVASDGGVFTFGDAGFYGSLGGIKLDKPVVGIVPTGDGHGYTLIAGDGGVFNFGDSRFLGAAPASGGAIVG